jgi:hypothetical protein
MTAMREAARILVVDNDPEVLAIVLFGSLAIGCCALRLNTSDVIAFR